MPGGTFYLHTEVVEAARLRYQYSAALGAQLVAAGLLAPTDVPDLPAAVSAAIAVREAALQARAARSKVTIVQRLHAWTSACPTGQYHSRLVGRERIPLSAVRLGFRGADSRRARRVRPARCPPVSGRHAAAPGALPPDDHAAVRGVLKALAPLYVAYYGHLYSGERSGIGSRAVGVWRPTVRRVPAHRATPPGPSVGDEEEAAP